MQKNVTSKTGTRTAQDNKKHIRTVFREGMRDGLPIALGYFAVSFSLGIAAKNAGLTPFQGLLASVLNNASAGEFAAFTLIAADAGYIQMALMTLITNLRYVLMSCALSQKFSPKTPFYHRLLIGFDVTDELFGIAVAREGFIEPRYMYGAFLLAIPGWGFGTALGIIAGNILPLRLVSALSVALYGMFLAIIIPPSRDNKKVAVVVTASFLLSLFCAYAPFLSRISSGMRTMILTVGISCAAAFIFPVKQEDSHEA